MDLAAQYRGLYHAALFTAECAEDAYRLGALDSVLKPWLRGQLESREHSLSYCDSRMDLAAAVEGLAAIAPRYAELRRDLFGDMHHIGRPVPTWRAVGPTLTVLAPLQVWRQPPAYALRLRDPGTAAGGAQTWDFIVFTRSGDPREPGTVHTAMLFPDTDANTATGTGRRTVQVTKQLEVRREDYEQLTYAFQSLTANVHFAALHDPDRGQNPPPDGV
ncbi:hypothetical protein ACIRL2_08820 [Embleya sp. NPDC127516]|uniref:hypothetical protein n=1 Tax=Embleya sp. NPDC127516 TaxID=3363990 RepID=UPI00382C5BB8